ncbi:MAG: translesion error-prone DNA polymerase V autoproteolytic subunit [Candidatus Cloacimonetes bacterium]|jgi:DNA polymerase V|nr:translesion error-prone DNA polymerase V autoproteolytic subunit [Candidatus Cloacimonadota bacterium]MCB5288141.1 translesion error-prone DNA polymerase V autoproteolytic subunit [Candidatus Cloacimonadota bacterium]MCK9184954.1 translesion error-prone DNA polymerase V autoproteolytic subunit [Candidatus Cloacimonadota bacterium]MCK9584692.1 translesion error-prone DNA polymerase V autoproteolytic subunit [Candidatus Cloacimonadota bacterium]MDY0230465.1 translesion error-prone DNA polymera
MKNFKTDGSIKAIYKAVIGEKVARPLFSTRVPAGFPSPATDYTEKELDLNERLILHKKHTYFMEVEGYSMIGAGIYPGDLAIVDRAIEPSSNKVVIAIVDGEFMLKRLIIKNSEYWLVPENDEFQPLKITEDADFIIWGVVTYVIHPV